MVDDEQVKMWAGGLAGKVEELLKAGLPEEAVLSALIRHGMPRQLAQTFIDAARGEPSAPPAPQNPPASPKRNEPPVPPPMPRVPQPAVAPASTRPRPPQGRVRRPWWKFW